MYIYICSFLPQTRYSHVSCVTKCLVNPSMQGDVFYKPPINSQLIPASVPLHSPQVLPSWRLKVTTPFYTLPVCILAQPPVSGHPGLILTHNHLNVCILIPSPDSPEHYRYPDLSSHLILHCRLPCYPYLANVTCFDADKPMCEDRRCVRTDIQ